MQPDAEGNSPTLVLWIAVWKPWKVENFEAPRIMVL